MSVAFCQRDTEERETLEPNQTLPVRRAQLAMPEFVLQLLSDLWSAEHYRQAFGPIDPGRGADTPLHPVVQLLLTQLEVVEEHLGQLGTDLPFLATKQPKRHAI